MDTNMIIYKIILWIYEYNSHIFILMESKYVHTN